MIKLLSERYINFLYEEYKELRENKELDLKMKELEKELTKYNGLIRNQGKPEYKKFNKMVYEKYLKEEDQEVNTRYKGFEVDEYSSMPTYFLYFHLLAKRSVQIKEFGEKYSVEEVSTNPQMRLYGAGLMNDLNLLNVLLNERENLVALVVNRIDNLDVEYLDDNIEELDSLGIKHRFMKAIEKKEKTMAFKLMGRLKELDQGENYYLEAVVHFTDEDFENAIRYAKKVNLGDIDYGAATGMILESYAALGDIEKVIDSLNYNKRLKYSKSFIVFLQQKLVSALDFKDTDDLNKSLDGLEGALNSLDMSQDDDHYFKEQSKQNFAKIAVEGIALIEDAIYYLSINEDNNLKDDTIDRLAKLRYILGLMDEDRGYFLDAEYVVNKGIGKVKEEISRYFLNLILNESERVVFSNFHLAFMIQYQLGFVSIFCDNIEHNIVALLQQINAGEGKAVELIELAYMEREIAGQENNMLEYMVTELGLYDGQLKIDIRLKQIESFLSYKGKLAFSSAEWIYNKTLEEDYGWKDAGLLSLAYFRIIELELNEKIILPMIENLGIDALEKAFNDELFNLKGAEKNRFRSKWGILINGFKDIANEKKDIEGIMLGSMEYFLNNMGSNYSDDKLSNLVYKSLEEILNKSGIEALKSGKIVEIINNENRNKYRNPPAHTKFLNYEIACEAREFIIKEMINLSNYIN